MQFPILVEPTADGRFRAEIGEPFRLSAVAHDAQHALDELVRQVQQRLRSGARVAVLTVDNGSIQVTAPFLADDAYKADWVYRELTEEMVENRRLEDAVGP
ncbi:MAG TPA: hypothetical protein VFA18_09930 [Gemmataceae bacterium]|nr:hypothetical protein [Gemmataceae bacterium]